MNANESRQVGIKVGEQQQQQQQSPLSLLFIYLVFHLVRWCYIPEFETLLLIFLLIYGYDFILYHMITYLCSRF